ncbi:amphi-Trp domain-containing protein [Natronosalvus caseinilyticus]|uniref:amphi-Trp domain-containing protein n=1 Tax=Natronosalvus caseinilyticus TaxID=2953747 RepID=UPI0028B032E0|nr:amphi-Trp domain-containing protein [Natronosalvus caseinilyticus]
MADDEHEHEHETETETETEAESQVDETETESDETEREGERVMSRSDGAAILREVADGVENGTIDIEGEDGFTVDVPERFELEVEYEVTDDEAEFEVELEWPMEDGEAVAPDDDHD